MAMTDFKIIRRSLLSRLFSTAITSLTVATAVGLMVILLTMPNAGQAAFSRGNGNMHMLVSRDPSALQSVLNGIFYARIPGNPIEWSKYEQLRSAYPMLEYAIPIQQGDSYRGFAVLATTPEFFSSFKPRIDEEWVFTEGRAIEQPFEVVIGAEVARQQNINLNDELVLSHGASSIEDTATEDEHEEDDAIGPGHSHQDFHFTVVGLLHGVIQGQHDRNAA